MNFVKAAFFAALLAASPTRGDLLSGDMVKATGGGGADALDGRSNEGLGVTAPRLRGGRENSHHRQQGSEGSNGDDEVDWIRSDNSKEDGFGLGLNLVIDGDDDEGIYNITKTDQSTRNLQIGPRYKIVKSSFWSTMCFDVKNYSTRNGNPIQLTSCSGNNAQLFRFDSGGRIRSILNQNKCISGGTAGTLHGKLFIWDCNNGAHQRWYRYTSGRIRNAHHGRYIGVDRACNVPSYSQRYLSLKSYDGGPCSRAQKWSW